MPIELCSALAAKGKFTSSFLVLTLAATPATAIDNVAWRCGETLVIASISQKTINIAVSGPKKANDVVTVTSDPLGAFLNGQTCKRVADE